MIRVRSNLKNKNRVALWERHPDHPGGEVKIADERVYEVAETQTIRDALKNGVLTEVEPEPQPKRRK